MTRPMLQAQLEEAQKAYLALSTGTKAVTLNYTQGAGGKGVTYQQTSLPNLVALIKQLQAQLGIVHRPRSPMRPVYR